MKRNDAPITVEAGKHVYRGFSVARAAGKVIFVRGLLPGETAEVRVIEDKTDYCVAVVTALLTSSPHRIMPRCGLFGSCGGCHYQYTSYDNQLALKESVLSDTFSRIALSNIPLSPRLASPLPWAYRYRAQFKVSPRGLGFYREGSHDVVPVPGCPLMADEINSLLARLQDVFRHAPALFEGTVEIHLAHGDSTIAALKTVLGPREQHRAQNLCHELIALGLNGVILKGDGGLRHQFGCDHTNLMLGGLRYTVSADSFFQANWRLNQMLVETIKDKLRPLEGLTILDLYAGAGNFSLPLAGEAKSVIAVEQDAGAAAWCRHNADANGLRNVQCLNNAVESLSLDAPVHVVILDPPRPGLTRSVRGFLHDLRPERIVYVSCNPASMARDIRSLLDVYKIESMHLVDFFPQTYHIEAVAFLRKVQDTRTLVSGPEKAWSRSTRPSDRARPRRRQRQKPHS